jgi:hypothetical protein
MLELLRKEKRTIVTLGVAMMRSYESRRNVSLSTMPMPTQMGFA